jgi:hypothetical protein
VVAESSIPAAIRRKKKASTAQARQSRRAIRQRRQRCGRARRASRAHLPRSRYGVVQAARSQDGGLKNEGREAAPEHKPREPAPVAAGRDGPSTATLSKGHAGLVTRSARKGRAVLNWPRPPTSGTAIACAWRSAQRLVFSNVKRRRPRCRPATIGFVERRLWCSTPTCLCARTSSSDRSTH